MSDRERATAFICTHLGFDPMESTGDIEALADEFDRVRRDERRAIVAFLRAAAPTRKRGAAALIAAADLIERRVDGS